MPRVTFVNEKQHVEVVAGANLRLAGLQAGIPLYSLIARYVNCRGFGLCGTCRVLVTEGMENLSSKTLIEQANLYLHPLTLLSRLGREKEMRLACQCQVNGDCTIVTTTGINLTGEEIRPRSVPVS